MPIKQQSAQTVLEYVLMISVVTAIIMAMSTMVRRSAQSMVKVVADQVGFQQNAEQDDPDSGYLVRMTTEARQDQQKRVIERPDNIDYFFNETSTAEVESRTNLGPAQR